LQQLLQLAWPRYNNGVASDAQKRRIWTFATGQAREIDALTRAFSVYRQTEGGTISHGLATALINRDGKIEKIWRGNAWTPAEVTGAIQAESK
jgi:cytochrome oxidase Cu insertion factor (SCO1/SenC/PrrC family)